MSRWLTLLLVSAVALAHPRPAAAAPGDGSEQGSGGRSDDVITAAVRYRSEGSGSDGGGSECSWAMIDGQIGVPNLGVATWPHTTDGITYHLWRRTCPSGVAFVQLA